MPTAAKQAGLALQLATDSLSALLGDKPLLKFIESDEDDDKEIMGDLLRRQPNIITDAYPSDFFPQAALGNRREARDKLGWDNFVQWSDKEYPGGKSLLLAYSLWLARKHGQSGLLSLKCDAFAAKLNSLQSK